jgi:hypothetical protein
MAIQARAGSEHIKMSGASTLRRLNRPSPDDFRELRGLQIVQILP